MNTLRHQHSYPSPAMRSFTSAGLSGCGGAVSPAYGLPFAAARASKPISPVTRFLVATVALCSWLVAGPAWSGISAVSVAPTSASIPLGQPTSVTVVWTVTRFTTVGLPVPGTVTSSQGQFVVSGGATAVVLATVNSVLSRPNVADLVPVTLVESVLVPQDVAQRAFKLGVSNLLYRRTFVDSVGGATLTGSVTLNVSSSAASGFGVRRMALSFDNGAPVRVLGLKDPLHALAEVDFNGNGLLQGVWEIAGPTSTAGEPFYRPLSTVRQYLVGGDKQTLRSPDLPTESAGLYLVRLRITDPVPGFDQPVVRYFVGSGRPGEKVPALSVGLVTPPHRSLLAPDTTFAWEPIRGARAYQLEVYAKPRTPGDTLPDIGGEADTTTPALPPTPPVTGMLIAGTQTRASLSAVAHTHLLPGRAYLWRVLAIGGDGTIVGESPLRELRTP